MLEYAINPVLAALLYVTFLQVPAAELVRSLRAGRFLAAALVVNFFVVPLVVAAMFAFLPADQAVRLRVLLVLLTPCVDYVIVFSGLAGGDSRRLLAATPLLLAAAVLPHGRLGSPGGMVTAEDELQPQPCRLRPHDGLDLFGEQGVELGHPQWLLGGGQSARGGSHPRSRATFCVIPRRQTCT
ncbi:hypothetical protein [Streptosporangium sp. KLBMP 9127]|nr:hypothetical protein [Streptosporangium sp. KLBMP 9127]